MYTHVCINVLYCYINNNIEYLYVYIFNVIYLNFNILNY